MERKAGATVPRWEDGTYQSHGHGTTAPSWTTPAATATSPPSAAEFAMTLPQPETPPPCLDDADSNSSVLSSSPSPSSHRSEDDETEEKKPVVPSSPRRRVRDRLRRKEKRQQIQQMRQELQQLQSHLDTLSQHLEAQRLSDASNGSSSTGSSPKGSPSMQSILGLVMETQQLRRENEAYKRRIREQELVSNAIRTIYKFDGVHEQVPRAMSHPSHCAWDYDQVRFLPFTEEDCNELILKSLETGQRQRLVLSGNDGQPHSIGWQGRRWRQGDALKFCQSTRIMGFNAVDMMKIYWKLRLDVDKVSESFTQPVYLKILQRIGDNAVVFRRVTRNVRNGVLNHVLFLSYRMRRGDEIVVGIKSLPLFGNGRSNVAGDELGRSLLQPDETTIDIHCWSAVPVSCSVGEDARASAGATGRQECGAPPADGGAPVCSMMHRWGGERFDTTADAEFWEQEVMDAGNRFQLHVVRALLKPFKSW